MFSAQGSQEESRPLLRSLSEASVNRIWFGISVATLATAWCLIDSWNHSTISSIFNQNEVTDVVMNPFTGQTVAEVEPFNFVLTLALLQFVFMAMIFCVMYAFTVSCTGGSISNDMGRLRSAVDDKTLPGLVGTHLFGSLLVQSLIMPTSMMSLGVFAATRAVEIPVAAGVRSKIFGFRFGGHSPVTIGAMFGAAMLLFYSHTQIAECLCVWSGHGVAITGLPLFFMYALLLTIPASNIVLQESMMVRSHVSPLLLQAVQNLGAAVLFAPVLLGAHWLGFENVHHALEMITGHFEIYMSVLWLCMQSSVLSAVTVGLIWMVDSFWCVAAHSLRVVFWWLQQLAVFYISSSSLLSVVRPHASLWSLGMICGMSLGLAAVALDSKPSEENSKLSKGLQECHDAAEAQGPTARYV